MRADFCYSKTKITSWYWFTSFWIKFSAGSGQWHKNWHTVKYWTIGEIEDKSCRSRDNKSMFFWKKNIFGGLLCLTLGRWFGSWKSLPKICVQADVIGIKTQHYLQLRLESKVDVIVLCLFGLLKCGTKNALYFSTFLYFCHS